MWSHSSSCPWIKQVHYHVSVLTKKVPQSSEACLQRGAISKELKAINEHRATVCHGPWNTNGQTCPWKQTLVPKCAHHKESKSKFENQSLVCFSLGLSTSCSLLADSKEVLKEETSAKQSIYSSWQGRHPISLSTFFWRENELDS